MKARSTLKREKTKEREKIFLEYLKSLAVEIDREYFLPSIATLNIYQNPSATILRKLKERGKIIALGKRSELDSDLMKRIEEKLNKEPEKKKLWFWRNFFMNPLRVEEGKGKGKYFKNTSVLYCIK